MGSDVMLSDEVPQLLDDGVDEFLTVPVRLLELSKDVVLPARLLHPAGQRRKPGIRWLKPDTASSLQI